MIIWPISVSSFPRLINVTPVWEKIELCRCYLPATSDSKIASSTLLPMRRQKSFDVSGKRQIVTGSSSFCREHESWNKVKWYVISSDDKQSLHKVFEWFTAKTRNTSCVRTQGVYRENKNHKLCTYTTSLQRKQETQVVYVHKEFTAKTRNTSCVRTQRVYSENKKHKLCTYTRSLQRKQETQVVFVHNEWNRTRPRALVQNQHTRELICARKTSHKQKQQRPESPKVTLTGMRVNSRYINSTRGILW